MKPAYTFNPSLRTTAALLSAFILASGAWAQSATKDKDQPANQPAGKQVNKSANKPANKSLDAQFAAADVDKTGKLTKKQAFNAKLYEIDRYFFDMDADIDGYVSLDELKAWKANPVRTAPRPRGDKLDRFVDGDGTVVKR